MYVCKGLGSIILILNKALYCIPLFFSFFISCCSFLYHISFLPCSILFLCFPNFLSTLSWYTHILLSCLSLLYYSSPPFYLPSPALFFLPLFHFSLISTTPPIFYSYAISLCAFSQIFLLSLSIPCLPLCTFFALTSPPQHASCLVSSLQSPGVAGSPLPRSAPAGLCQLAAGPLPALHLHHRLLQHLEGSQDVWKGN